MTCFRQTVPATELRPGWRLLLNGDEVVVYTVTLGLVQVDVAVRPPGREVGKRRLFTLDGMVTRLPDDNDWAEIAACVAAQPGTVILDRPHSTNPDGVEPGAVVFPIDGIDWDLHIDIPAGQSILYPERLLPAGVADEMRRFAETGERPEGSGPRRTGIEDVDPSQHTTNDVAEAVSDEASVMERLRSGENVVVDPAEAAELAQVDDDDPDDLTFTRI